MIPRIRKRKDRPASDVLEEAVAQYQTDVVSIGEIMQVLHERGFGILMIVFALPNCIPIPTPGFLSLTAVPLLFFAAQMMLGMDHPWLPRWIERRSIRRHVLAQLVSGAAPRMKKIEKWLRPRLSFATSQAGEKIIGIFCFIFALSIAIPIPGTNFVPGLGILIMSFGLLSRDGVVILIGLATGLVGLVITCGILIFGAKAVSALMGMG